MSSPAISVRALSDAATRPSRWLIVGVAATAVASLIGVLAFVFGEQPIRGDGLEYRRLGTVIASQGFGHFSSDTRTYAYPAFLALLISFVGNDPASLRPVLFAAQLIVYLAGSAVGAVRIGRAVGSRSLGLTVFAVTVLNPFPLFHCVQVLTDVLSAVLIYVAVTLSLPQTPRESRRRVGMLGVLAFLLAGLAVMVRPANLVLIPALVLVWSARAWIYRDLPRAAIPAMLVALALPFAPQVAANQRAFGVTEPVIVRDLYSEHLEQGIRHAKYVTLGISGLPNRAIYLNPFFPADVGYVDAPRMLREFPGSYAATAAIHAFALVDQDFPFTYVRDLDPWYRWPLSILNYLFLAGAVVGLASGLRQWDGADDQRRRWFTLATLAVVSAALVALYLPAEVENRFSLPLYPLLTLPCVLAAVALPQQLRSTKRWALAAGAMALVAWLVGAAGLSIWLQEQSPVLTSIRAHRELPAPERPVAALRGELPRQWTAGQTQTLVVEATNLGDQAWNAEGFYHVTLAIRFSPIKESQYLALGDFRRQYVALPDDVPPDGSITVAVDALAPPTPGRYSLEVQVFRHGVPDPDESLERMVRVER